MTSVFSVFFFVCKHVSSSSENVIYFDQVIKCNLFYEMSVYKFYILSEDSFSSMNEMNIMNIKVYLKPF